MYKNIYSLSTFCTEEVRNPPRKKPLYIKIKKNTETNEKHWKCALHVCKTNKTFSWTFCFINMHGEKVFFFFSVIETRRFIEYIFWSGFVTCRLWNLLPRVKPRSVSIQFAILNCHSIYIYFFFILWLPFLIGLRMLQFNISILSAVKIRQWFVLANGNGAFRTQREVWQLVLCIWNDTKDCVVGGYWQQHHNIYIQTEICYTVYNIQTEGFFLEVFFNDTAAGTCPRDSTCIDFCYYRFHVHGIQCRLISFIRHVCGLLDGPSSPLPGPNSTILVLTLV